MAPRHRDCRRSREERSLVISPGERCVRDARNRLDTRQPAHAVVSGKLRAAGSTSGWHRHCSMRRPCSPTLAPGGPAAEGFVTLATVMAAGAAVILVLVMALLVHGALGEPRRTSTGLWVIGGGILFPVAVLSALVGYDQGLTHALTAPASPGAPRIEVEGRQWWWEVRYLAQAADRNAVITANEIHIPTGVAVELILTTPDVIHSFWVPSLAGKVDMVPGRRNRLTLQADREGRLPGAVRGVLRGPACPDGAARRRGPDGDVSDVAGSGSRPGIGARHAGDGPRARRVPRSRLRWMPHHPGHRGAGQAGTGSHARGEPTHVGVRERSATTWRQWPRGSPRASGSSPAIGCRPSLIWIGTR